MSFFSLGRELFELPPYIHIHTLYIYTHTHTIHIKNFHLLRFYFKEKVT